LEGYQEIIDEPGAFRQWVDKRIECYPELFPATIDEGCTLHDTRSSPKMPDIRLQRIRWKVCDGQRKAVVFTIAPSAVVPYTPGYRHEVVSPLFLPRFGVPFWALSRLSGGNDQ
jgi:hypothetical protein